MMMAAVTKNEAIIIRACLCFSIRQPEKLNDTTLSPSASVQLWSYGAQQRQKSITEYLQDLLALG